MKLHVGVYFLAAGLSYCASIEGASFELVHPNLTLSKTTVTGASPVGAPGGPFAPSAINYHCRLADAIVGLSEGAITLPSTPDLPGRNLWSRRRSDERFSAHTFVFREETGWSVVFMIGQPVRDDWNITRGLCLSVRAPSSAAAAGALREVASALVIFVGRPLSPKKLSDLNVMSMIADVIMFLDSKETNSERSVSP